MDKKVMYSLTYGLYVITTVDGDKKNGCIMNTAMQQTSDPSCISVTLNKTDYTEYMLERSGKFNISTISDKADFSLFKHFGFQSGRDIDKFADFTDYKEAANGIPYITKGCNAYLSCEVADKIDLGTHVLFIANVIDGEVISTDPSASYAYYQANIKPAAKKVESTGKVWVCKICGYVYDDSKEAVPFEQLPNDWTCPICKHPKSDFVLQS